MTAQDLKQWRIRLGLSQRAAAALLGITEQGYIKREHDKSTLTAETLYATRYIEDHASTLLEPPRHQELT